MNYDIKWLHAPGHSRSVGPKVIERAVKTGAQVIDWSEMYFNIDDLLKHAPEYDHFVGEPQQTDSRGRVVNHDVVISIRAGRKILHKEEFFVDKARINAKIHPERRGKALVFEDLGVRVLVIAWHPQPAVLKRPMVLLPGYKESVRRVEAVHDRLVSKYNPDLVVAGGDLQLGKGTKWFYPNRMAHRMKLDWHNIKIDWQMWSPAFREIRFHTIDPSTIQKGMDHPWMVRVLSNRKDKS